MDLIKLKSQLDQAQKIATPRIALLWGSGNLLGEAIESILNADRNWQVVKILGSRDVDALAQAVKRVRPEIVIVNQGHCAEEFPSPVHLIGDFPELKIITINSTNNLMEVYNKQTVCMKDVADLLSIIGE